MERDLSIRNSPWPYLCALHSRNRLEDRFRRRKRRRTIGNKASAVPIFQIYFSPAPQSLTRPARLQSHPPPSILNRMATEARSRAKSRGRVTARGRTRWRKTVPSYPTAPYPPRRGVPAQRGRTESRGKSRHCPLASNRPGSGALYPRFRKRQPCRPDLPTAPGAAGAFRLLFYVPLARFPRPLSDPVPPLSQPPPRARRRPGKLHPPASPAMQICRTNPATRSKQTITATNHCHTHPKAGGCRTHARIVARDCAFTTAFAGLG